MTELSTRSKNGLKHLLKKESPSPQDVSELTATEILSFQPTYEYQGKVHIAGVRLGKKSIDEIRAWLAERGLDLRSEVCPCCGQKLPRPVNNPTK